MQDMMTDQDQNQVSGGGDAQAVNPKKLFVGSIAFTTTEQELQELFAQYGEIVDLKLITDKMTGRSKGIAFVEYATEEQAQAALSATNNVDFGGRTLFVSVARPQVKRERGSFGGGGSRGGFGGGRGGSGGGRSFDRRGGGGDSRGGFRSSSRDSSDRRW